MLFVFLKVNEVSEFHFLLVNKTTYMIRHLKSYFADFAIFLVRLRGFAITDHFMFPLSDGHERVKLSGASFVFVRIFSVV